MARKLFFYLFLAALYISSVASSFSLEKVKLGGAVRTGASFYSPILTAEKRGFWKENGLEVEWVPFAGAAPEMRAIAAGALSMGMSTSETPMAAIEKGVPVIMVAEYVSEYSYCLWVRTDSPYQHPRDLKGARIAVTTLGGTTHALGRIITRAHGVEKDVRFVGAGGVLPAVAGMKAGAFDALVSGPVTCVRLKIEGVAREIASEADYLPKPWVHTVIFVRKDYARSKADMVRKVLRATLQATDFMTRNSRWTMDLIKGFGGASEEEAKLLYERLQFNPTGKIDRQGMENAKKLYIEYGILTEKAPAVDEFFANEYLPS